jgi:hypothetical protein
MQDFAPFTLSGLQTPGRKGSRASSAQRMAVPSASICLLLQNLLTSLLIEEH